MVPTSVIPSILTNYSDEEVLAFARRLGLDTLGSVSAELMKRLEKRIDEIEALEERLTGNSCDECGSPMRG